MKAVMALHEKVLPPTLKVDRPDPELKLSGSSFYVNSVVRPWIRGSDHPRRASVSSFGFGGTNYHIALEEYVPDCATALRTTKNELFLYSAETPVKAADLCQAAALERGDIAAMAQASQQAFSAAAPVRVAIVAA